MSKRVWLAALTAAFMAGSMAIAHAQMGGGGGGAGGGAGGGGASSGGGGGQGGGETMQGRNGPSRYYKDERFPQRR